MLMVTVRLRGGYYWKQRGGAAKMRAALKALRCEKGRPPNRMK